MEGPHNSTDPWQTLCKEMLMLLHLAGSNCSKTQALGYGGGSFSEKNWYFNINTVIIIVA